jgi:hypothetical protein
MLPFTEKVLARPIRVVPTACMAKSALGALTELGRSAWVAESYKEARAFVESRVNHPQFRSAQGIFTERVGHSVMARSSDGQKEGLEWQSTMKHC